MGKITEFVVNHKTLSTIIATLAAVGTAGTAIGVKNAVESKYKKAYEDGYKTACEAHKTMLRDATDGYNRGGNEEFNKVLDYYDTEANWNSDGSVKPYHAE